MKATGIICEYNPFHYGHAYHIQETRKQTACDVLVCVMSGNYVQRGEPAIIHKWERTRTALMHGVDLVLELPFAFATQSAAYFAQGAVDTLALAQVHDLVFGSETNDLTTLQKLAALDGSSYRDLMAEGLSCAKAYEIIYGRRNPNDILGINYLQACKPHRIQAHCIQRTNSYHETSIASQHASASALRHALKRQETITAWTPMQIDPGAIRTLDQDYPLLQGLLLTLPQTYMKSLFLMDEGIEAHLRNQAAQADDLETFLQLATSRRYSTSRIRRTLLHLMMQTRKEDIDALPPLSHIRALGFNDVGRAYLKELKETGVTIASRINQLPLPYRMMEMKAAQMYGLWGNRKKVVELEIQPPIRI